MTEPNTEAQPAVSTEQTKPLSVEEMRKMFEEIAEARIAPLAKKYNGEHAGHRKEIDALKQTLTGGGQAPKPAEGAGEGQAPKSASEASIAKSLREIGRLEAKLPEKIRLKLEAEIEAMGDVPVSTHVEKYRSAVSLWETLREDHEAAEAEKAKAAKEKPGRDARSTGSQRAYAPATRAETGLPSHFREWIALPEDKRVALLEAHPDFDPRALPMK